MSDNAPWSEWLGYCSNVHAGIRLAQTRQNLQQHALEVKRELGMDHPMGIGLWLSSVAAAELSDSQACDEFRDWLQQVELVPFTFNGFPFGDFHQKEVKHAVYHPTWAESSRLDYTVMLAKIMDKVLPVEMSGNPMSGTISTLPLGWPENQNSRKLPRNLSDRSQRALPQLVSPEFLTQATCNLDRLVEELEFIEQKSGRRIMVCLEPEPGCLLETAEDLCRFFDSYLLDRSPALDARTRRYLGVCHDICHSAVMFESQASAIEQYRQRQLEIGKVQVSSAVKMVQPKRADVLQDDRWFQTALLPFSEPKYLHQSVIQHQQQIQFFEDLPLAMQYMETLNSSELELRVHFHVPIFLSEMDRLETTQQEIVLFKQAIDQSAITVPHWEIETYAWGVLPVGWKYDRLSEGIAQEWRWLTEIDKSQVT